MRTRTGCTMPFWRIDSASSAKAVWSNFNRGCHGPELIHSTGISITPPETPPETPACVARISADCDPVAGSGRLADPEADAALGKGVDVAAAIPASPSKDDRPRPRPRAGCFGITFSGAPLETAFLAVFLAGAFFDGILAIRRHPFLASAVRRPARHRPVPRHISDHTSKLAVRMMALRIREHYAE